MKTLVAMVLAIFVVAGVTPAARAAEFELIRAAKIAESEHRFADADQLLRQHLQTNPRNGEAWIHLASIATVRADADTASSACARAANYVDPIATLACRGRVALVTQQYGPAYAALKKMLHHPHYLSLDDRWTSWARGVAAELSLALHLHAEADEWFARALATNPSKQLRSARLDHLLATERQDEVLTDVARSETDTALQLRRLIALRQLGREGEAVDLVTYLDWLFRSDLEQRNLLHAREIARFYLDVLPDSVLALKAAEENLAFQREAEDYDLYRRAQSLQTKIHTQQQRK